MTNQKISNLISIELNSKFLLQIIITSLISIISLVLFVILPFIQGLIYEYSLTTLDGQLGKKLGSAIIFVSIIITLLNTLKRVLVSHTRGDSIKIFRNSLYSKLLKYSQSWHNSQDNGDIIQRLMTEVEMVAVLRSRIPIFITNIFQLLVIYGVFIFISPHLFGVITISMLALLIWNMVCKIPLSKLNNQIGVNSSSLYGFTYTFFRGIKQIKCFNMHSHYSSEMRKILNDFRWSLLKRDIVSAIMQQGGTLQVSFTYLIFLSIIFFKIKQGELNISDYVLYSALLYFTAEPVLEMSEFYNHFQIATTGKKRLNSLLDGEKEENPGTKHLASLKKITFRNIHFNYPGTEKSSLSNISFQIPKGSNIGIVGGSGSGKSTLINLLMRLYTPSQGEILIDDTPISEFELHQFREKIGYISQRVALFTGTIRDNIDLENKLSEQEIIHACQNAHIYDWIQTFPDGLDTYVGERGTLLSGGERQRVALARTLSYNPNILILDEPTSALDPNTEAKLMASIQMIRQHNPDLTTISITHNYNFLKDTDRIYLFEWGNIYEQGTLAELTQNGEKFQKLFQLKRDTNVH